VSSTGTSPVAPLADSVPRHPVVVVHPETVDVPAFRGLVESAFERAGWPAPEFAETTCDEPGSGLAKHAIADDADLVVVVGGDGTVRAVAVAMAGTGVPLAVVPTGTGNLLARNLGIPVDQSAALDVVVSGRDQQLDLGRTEETYFVTMAGLGLDAAMVRDANPELKKRFGWPAYIVSGAKHLYDPQMRLRLRIDGGQWIARHAQVLVIGNVGELQAGAALLPAADPSDGKLDLVLMSPRSLFDWARVLVRLATRHAREDQRLNRLQFRTLEVEARYPVPHEVDGDPAGDVTRLNVEVVPAALTIRVPA
jgi:YegS/Rv2252/BmrU family lipid kinase